MIFEKKGEFLEMRFFFWLKLQRERVEITLDRENLAVSHSSQFPKNEMLSPIYTELGKDIQQTHGY